MNIEKNIELKKYTTFKIGGPAKYFVEVKTIEELQECLIFAKENSLEIFILGGGSNILISDQGFNGLVIKITINILEFKGNNITVGSGVILSYLLNQSLEKSLIGLEFATGIPGTVGGAVRGNAGTYGLAMSNVVKKIKYLDEEYNIQEMNNNEAQFKYRHSIFKEKQYIILEVEIELEKRDTKESYKLVKERLKYRQDTQPNKPSAGCIFKNLSFKDLDIDNLREKGIEIDKFTKHEKIPAGYLIDRVDLKGKTIGGVKISEIHANYIVNVDNGTAEPVIMLISLIKQQVRDKYGIELKEEIQLVL